MSAATGMNDKLKFGLIGCGRIAKNHVKALACNDEAKLAALCDIDKAKAEALAEAFVEVDPVIYTDYLQMLAQESLDAVAICTESGYHAQHAKDALEAGCHVLVEKPIALSVKDADDMIFLIAGYMEAELDQYLRCF